MTTVNPPKRAIWAAGGVLHRSVSGEREYLLVHRERYNDWSLPKGKLERGESFLEAALREVEEETGFKGNRPLAIGTTGYETTGGKPKVVRWWLLGTKKGKFVPNSEVDQIRWLPIRRAMKQLSYDGERGVLERAGELAASKRSGRIYLARHAWASSKAEWKGRDWLRPLDRHGIRQAKRLYLDFETIPLTRVLSSHYKRCVDTVRGLAVGHGLPLEKDKRLGARSDADTALDVFRSLEGESALVCSHGEVIGDVIGKLSAEGIDLDGPMEWRKGSVWILETHKGRVKRGRYRWPA